MFKRKTCFVFVGVLLVGGVAEASHVPVALDVPVLWTPSPGSGYLNFMTPGATVFPLIATEEHTGFTMPGGFGVVDPLGPPVFPAGPDNEPFAGDRADFDWVQEDRLHETAVPPISNHPGIGGYMGWNATPTMPSPHTTVGIGPHGHSMAEVPPGPLPELLLPDYGGKYFRGVDVFSQITSLDMDLGGPREAALDYFVEFSNTMTGMVTPGVPVIVFIPGWTVVTGIDDYVARWVPADGGLYDQVAIDPESLLGHDEVTEIDAIVAFPEPATFALLLIGVGLAARRRR